MVLSGNNFQKIENLTRILKLHVISLITFHMYQRLYICPGIEKITGTTGCHVYMSMYMYSQVFCANGTPLYNISISGFE